MSAAAAVALSFAAGSLALLAALDLAREAAAPLARRAPRLMGAAARLAETVVRAGREGREPGAAERRRLLAALAVAAFAAGAFLAGPLAGAGAAAACPFALSRLLRARRERYRRAVDAGAAQVATALADALAGGHSLRGAIGEAARGVGGAAGRELRRASMELALGATTEDALEALRRRARSHAIDTVVAAALLQRRAGGDLARLLRDCALAFEDGARLRDEVRAATSQARFTGLLVILLPLGGALLAELASPGFLMGIAGSFLTAWLVGIALALQLTAAVAIRRLARVRS